MKNSIGKLLKTVLSKSHISFTIPVSPDAQTFHVMLTTLRESGASAHSAFAALEEMKSMGLDADRTTPLTLADLCCRWEEMALAEEVLKAATEENSVEYEKKFSSMAESLP